MSAGRLLPRRKLPRLSAGLGQIPEKDGNTMSKLVIVESPAKAKTIRKYLGGGYEVTASMGHIRDLPQS